jgi:hypothetical protein
MCCKKGRRSTLDKWLQISGAERKQNRHRNEVRCEVCLSKVPRHLLGKHLVSHYHYRKARSGHPQAAKLILDNIHSVVRQAPFQCSPCKFYCNTEASFKLHWASQEHEHTDRKVHQALFYTDIRRLHDFRSHDYCVPNIDTKMNPEKAEHSSFQRDFRVT